VKKKREVQRSEVAKQNKLISGKKQSKLGV
jgi:hypothetical protein